MPENQQPLYVLVPDQKAGEDYSGVLKDNGVKSTIVKVDWPARVVANENGENVINPEKESVANAMAESFIEVLSNRAESHFSGIAPEFSISCNTASASVFMDLVRKKLDERGFTSDKYIVHTTLEALANKFGRDIDKPMFFGTTVLSGELSKDSNFSTLHLYHSEGERLLNNVQEIIWRTKAIQNSVVDTAPVYEGDLKDEIIYNDRLIKLHDELIDLGLNRVILGCTELPYAFSEMRKLVEQRGEKFKIETIDPASIVAEQINMLRASAASN